jgi:hypothetical protein
MILRLYGRGRVVLPGEPQWDELWPHFDPLPGARQIIAAEIDLVQTSCGYVVPLFDYAGQRDIYPRWCQAKGGEEGLRQYRREKNHRSLDGLPTPLQLREQD